MLIFKIGEYEIENKKLSTTLNQLSKIECEDDSVSISGTIISIDNTGITMSISLFLISCTELINNTARQAILIAFCNLYHLPLPHLLQALI